MRGSRGVVWAWGVLTANLVDMVAPAERISDSWLRTWLFFSSFNWGEVSFLAKVSPKPLLIQSLRSIAHC